MKNKHEYTAQELKDLIILRNEFTYMNAQITRRAIKEGIDAIGDPLQGLIQSANNQSSQIYNDNSQTLGKLLQLS